MFSVDRQRNQATKVQPLALAYAWFLAPSHEDLMNNPRASLHIEDHTARTVVLQLRSHVKTTLVGLIFRRLGVDVLPSRAQNATQSG